MNPGLTAFPRGCLYGKAQESHHEFTDSGMLPEFARFLTISFRHLGRLDETFQISRPLITEARPVDEQSMLTPMGEGPKFRRRLALPPQSLAMPLTDLF